MKKEIVAFAGSNSTRSINKKLIRYVLTYFEEYRINLLDLNDFEMEIFSIDREEKNGYPEKAFYFRKKIEKADLIICSLAENNRSFSVAFKNIFDWCSRINSNIFRNKPMLLMSTSPGHLGGEKVIEAARNIFPAYGAEIVETFSLPRFEQNFDELKGIVNEALRSDLEHKIALFKKHIHLI